MFAKRKTNRRQHSIQMLTAVSLFIAVQFLLSSCAWVPFPEAFFCPEQFSDLNVSTGFFLLFPDESLGGGFTDLDMPPGQSVFATIPITLHQHLSAMDKDTNRPQITDVFVYSEKPIFFHHNITAQSP